MKRLFFSVFAFALGAFVLSSCDDDEKNNIKDEDGYMTVQQQRDAFQSNLSGIADAIEFTELSQAAEVVADVVGKKWSFMSLMPVLYDTVLANNDEFTARLSYIVELAMGDFESFEGADIDLRPIYMAADIHVVDTIIYNDSIAAVRIENFRADSTVNSLLLNVFVDNHVITLNAKIEPGETTLEYTNVSKEINSKFALPKIVDITLTLDGKVLADLKSNFTSDYAVSFTSDDESSWVIDGTKSSAKSNFKVAGYELDGKLDFDDAVGATGYLTAKYGTNELISLNLKMDATMTGVNMADKAQVLAWAQNPDKLKSIGFNTSIRGGKIEFKFNTLNPFKDEALARILRSQMTPGAKLTEEQEAEMIEKLNEIIDGGFYFEGYKDPQAKLKFIYREIADEAKPITDNEKIEGFVGADAIDAISEVLFKAGAYIVLTVHDESGNEVDMLFEEYFSGIELDGLKQALADKLLAAFGPLLAQFNFGEE